MLAFHNSHSTSKVGELLSKSVLVKKKENHDMLIYVIEGIRLLGRQGIAMRGSHMETGDSTSEPNSNMWQVLRAFGREFVKSHTDRARRIATSTSIY